MTDNDERESFYRDPTEAAGSENEALEDPMAVWNEKKKTMWGRVFGRSETPFVIMGVVLILLIIVFFVVLSRQGGQEANGRIASLSTRLDQVEKKLADLSAKVDAQGQLEGKVALLEKSAHRVDSVEAATSLRIDRVASDLGVLQKQVAATKTVPSSRAHTAAASTRSEKQKSPAGASYHVVQRGETLYSISRRYHLSVDAIRRMNGLTGRDVIYPGQRLKVKPVGK